MKMFVANCTQKVHDFAYRLPESPSIRNQRIEIGSYIQISGDLNQPEIDAIVNHHRRYGLVPADEVDRTKVFIGLFYTIDRRPNLDKVRGTIIHNLAVLEDRGREFRQQAAVAVSNTMEENAPPGALKSLEMSVVEERRDGKTVESDPSIAEGTRVTREHQGPPVPEQTGRRRTRRAA